MKRSKKELTQEEIDELNLVKEVRDDFFRRQQEKQSFEAQWSLNMNFYMGNQYCNINGNYELGPFENKFAWQEHQIFNHIAPIIERRLSKLSRVRPKMSVFPASNDECDLKTASLSKKIINSVYNTEDMDRIICEVTRWSEICGTGFYKVSWNRQKGEIVDGTNNEYSLRNGDVDIMAVSPFEIFPDNHALSEIEEQQSIIHARLFHVDTIKSKWGVEVQPESTNKFDFAKNISPSDTITMQTKTQNNSYAYVIERYETPSIKFPNGRQITVAGDKLVYVGELPYINGANKTRIFPFIKQTSISQPSCFWGTSVIERMIPLQRAYNAIKNRKHEFINRLSMGILTVEDGSIDVDALEDEGLCPGKVIVYRQGANKPSYMDNEKIPYDFLAEEQSVLDEFATISGVSDLTTENYITKGLSGTALSMMIEQDESKMLMSNDSIKTAIKLVAKQILRLYKQFVYYPKLTKLVGDNGNMELFYFTQSDIGSDDIVFETKNEYSDSFAQRRQLIFDLIDKGVLNDDEGKMSNRMKMKVLDIMGYGIWENASDIKDKHTAKAGSENYAFMTGQKVDVTEIDDHDIHINEHINFMLSGEFNKLKEQDKKLEDKMLAHIREHKRMKSLEDK